MVAVGLTATRKWINSPLLIPPWMPPEKSVWQGDADNRVILKIDQEPGVYEYSVYHKDTHVIVQGNSSPKIIITR